MAYFVKFVEVNVRNMRQAILEVHSGDVSFFQFD